MIKQITIKGYKSIKDAEVELAPINILIGGNGVGKSNFISVFSLVRNMYNRHLQEYVIKKGGADALLYMGRKVTQNMIIQLAFSNNNEIEAYNRFALKLTEVQGRLYIQETKTSFKSGGLWHEQKYDSYTEESDFKDKNYSQAYWVNSFLRQFDVYHFEDTGDMSPMKGFCDLDDNRRLRTNGANIAAYLYWLHEKHPNNYLLIERTVSSVSPFFAAFDLQPDRLNDRKIELRWRQCGHDDVYFNAYQLSDGTLRFICLVTLLLQPELPKTILIDEPELGLHPIAINKLAALMKKASMKSQIIVSTQSVSLVDNFAPSDIVVVDRKDDAAVFKRLNESEMAQWLKEYSLGEIWEKNVFGGLPQ